MRLVLFTLTCLQFSLVCSGQLLEQRIGTDACVCFESTLSEGKHGAMEGFINTCLKESLSKYKDEILKKFEITDTTEHLIGYKLGQKLAPEVMRFMVLDCDKFYYFFDSLRSSGKSNIDKSKVENDLAQSEEKIRNGEKTSETYFSRGMAYFKLEKFGKAKKDFEKSIELNDSFGPVYLYLGWTKEMLGDFPGARSDYQRSMELLRKNEIKLFISIAERKERDSKAR